MRVRPAVLEATEERLQSDHVQGSSTACLVLIDTLQVY